MALVSQAARFVYKQLITAVIDCFHPSAPQNASAGVSRMLLGNKCDIEAKRKVSKEVGEKVRNRFDFFFFFS